MALSTIHLKSTARQSERRRLTFQIRRLRQWCADSGLTQEELAAIAGVSPRTLVNLETTSQLPAAITSLLLVSLALQEPVEHLLWPHVIDGLRQEVERRRKASADTSERKTALETVPA